MKKYHLSATALADFDETSEFLLSKSVSASERWEAGILDGLHHIAEWPHTGHKNPLLGPSLRIWNAGEYVIVYMEEADPVFIVAILHGARNIPHIMQQR